MVGLQCHADLDLRDCSFARYSENCSPKFIELCMKTPCWCPSEGHQHGGRKVPETSRGRGQHFQVQVRSPTLRR